MLTEANVLILDEPTNHLDAVSKESLKQALKKYPGTVIVYPTNGNLSLMLLPYFQYRRSFVIVVFKGGFNERNQPTIPDLLTDAVKRRPFWTKTNNSLRGCLKVTFDHESTAIPRVSGRRRD